MNLLTVPEVAEMLRVNGDTVRRLARQGQLRGTKPASRWRFTAEDVAAYVDSTATTAPAPVVRRRRRRAA